MSETRKQFLLLWVFVGCGGAWAAEPVRFNQDIRPLLSNRCFRCHGPDKGARVSGLRLDKERLAKGKKPINVDSPRRFYSAIGAALLVALFTALAVYRGAPVALHLYVLDAKTATEQVTIAKLPRRFRRKHCNGKIYLVEYSAQFFDYVCQVTPRSQWEQLRPGQQIRLHGSRSALGFLARDTSL